MIKKEKIIKILLIVAFYALFICTNQVFANDTKSIDDLVVDVDTSIHTYTGEERRAFVQVHDENKLLRENKDYICTYNNDIEPGKASLVIEGIGEYSGTINKTYYIAPQKTKIKSVLFNADLTQATVTWEKIKNADGYRVYMSETKDGEYERIRTLEDNSIINYTKKGLDPNKTYYFKVIAYKEYEGKRITKKFSNPKTNTAKSIRGLEVNVDTSVHTYTGEARTASIQIYDGSRRLKRDKDYVVTYENNVETGKASLQIRGIVKYKGIINKSFYIAPQKAKITEVIFNSNFTKATISWESIWNASGYRIYMSDSKDGEYTRIKTIDNNWTTSYTKRGLDPNRIYWFKVRAYTQYEDRKICKKFSNPKSSGGLITSVSLTSPTSGPNRNHNLWLACSRLNGKIINPGETFNWFRDHGPASAARGYKEATVYQGTLSVPGYGGGVCQVSTTIYQAARNVGLEMVERHIHNKPVSYTKWGNDATVSYGAQNLIIRNNKWYKIKLVTYAIGGTTTCKIYRVL